MAAVLAGGGALTVAAGGPVSASACSDFSAVAAADGAHVSYLSPGYLVVEHTDVGAPAAQASADSVGGSSAYAAYPYPGAEALSGLGLANGSTSGAVGESTYPLIASSNYPTEKQRNVSGPGVELQATSDERSSAATGQAGSSTADGSSTGLTRAAATAGCNADGQVAATGDSDAEALAFGGGALRIGRVHTVARAVVGADGKTTLDAHLDVGQVTVAGQSVGINEKGIVVGGTTVPLGDSPLASALKSAGIGVTYVAASTDPDGRGVVAPAVQVQVHGNVTGTGTTTVTYTFGRAVARAQAAASGQVADRGSADVAPDVGATTPNVAAAPSGTGALLASPPRAGAPAALRAEPVRRTAVPDVSASFYLALVAGAVVLFAGAASFRLLGGRLE